MAKPRLSVTFNGRVIGTRSTDRPYTHAVILTDFDEDAARRSFAAHSTVDADAKSGWSFCRLRLDTPLGEIPKQTEVRDGRVKLCWSWPIEQRDKDSALKWLDGATTVEEFAAKLSAQSLARLEKYIALKKATGNCVLSWHSSRDLAFKAKDAARDKNPAYLTLVWEVDAR
jgi:hypothetical protein